MISPDRLKEMEERAAKDAAATVSDVYRENAVTDRHHLLRDRAELLALVRAQNEALAKTRASLADADRMVGWSSAQDIAQADAALALAKPWLPREDE